MAGPKFAQRLTGMVPSSAPGSKNRRKTSSYPFLLFHGLRFAQLVSSAIVVAITFYFIYNLRHDHWSVPWTFILLATVSSATIAALTFTIVLHCFIGLNPRLNLVFNGGLFIVWAVSFSLLSWWASGTISHTCNFDNWKEDIGVHVCRLYKGLFSFTMIGLMFTFFAILLDIYVLRLSTRRGRYNQMRDLDQQDRGLIKKELPQEETPALARMSAEVWNAAAFDADQDRPSTRMIDPIAPPKTYSEGARAEVGKDSYEPPAEPFNYDTGYHGNTDVAASRGQGYEGMRTG